MPRVRTLVRRTVRAAKPYAKQVGAYVAGASAQALTNSFTRTLTGRNEPGGVITGQHDFKTDYRRKRLSRRARRIKRSRYRRTRRLVRTIRNFNVGSTHINKTNMTLVTNTSGSTASTCYGLYGLNGSSTAANTTNDMGIIFNAFDTAAWNGQGGTTDVVDFKIYSHHATAEYTIRNSSTTDDAIIEAYFIRGRAPANKAYYGNPADVYADAFHKQADARNPDTAATIGTAMDFSDVGVTPFQAVQFCRLFSIYKRQKFRIPPGNEVSFVLIDRKPKTMRMDQSFNNSTDRNYHGVLFQQYGSPQAAGATPTKSTAVPVTYMCTRRYRIKMFRDNYPMDATI